ncbi:MAG: isoleucine--tRNA ligase [Candidatus Hadarchaeales archaeon]
MIQPAAKSYDAVKSEAETKRWWEDAGIYEKVKGLRAGKKPWYFLDGPPYASGSIHLGTAWNKIIKDAIIRYMTMNGFNVRRQPGWDCHGLPIEVKVEERLGIKTKKDIELRVGVENFIRECKGWAMEHVALMTQQFRELGVWMDWEDPYITFKNDYMEAAWWTLKKAHERGLLERSLRVIHWCPRCETALAEHEVRGEYSDVTDPSLYARFRIRGSENEYILIWTTTPWTIPANISVCVHPEYNYVKVEAGGATYIMAEALSGRVMNELGIGEWQTKEMMRGKDLEGIAYEHPLLDEVPAQKEYTSSHRIICGEHVTLEEGTGCVHTAPGHGEEDFEIGKRYNLPVFSPVGPDGAFTHDAGKYSGIFVKKADPIIMEDLRKKGVLMKSGKVLHSYPHCWRCGTPLIFRATEQWFLRVRDIKSRILERNSPVRWYPDWVATRYVNGVESVGDWCISRQRYWGIPIPVWKCDGCGKTIVVGGTSELRELAAEPIGDIDLHRPHVDRIVLRCPSCGGRCTRVPDVLDVWFDSGVASWGSLGYPNNQTLFKELWPADFITEGEDQVTKWFYSQQVLSVVAFDDVPYRKALMHGFVLDERGRKMSKSLGNVIDPLEVAKKHGADVLRFYMLSTNPPWEDLKFNLRELENVRRMMNVLWNVHVFATTYMSLDEFDPSLVNMDAVRRNMRAEDMWMLSRINSLISEITESMERYDLHRATRALSKFILDDMSRWYVKLVRERVWIERDDPKKIAAYVTLYQAMHVLIRLLAPFMPHLSEVMYRDLVKASCPGSPESVHMLPWPAPDRELIDENLEIGMEHIKAFVEAAASIRQRAGLKLRWPVRMVMIQPSDEGSAQRIKSLVSIAGSQINAKEVIIVNPGEEFKPPQESLTAETPSGRIAVDTVITPELRSECLAREVVRRLQMMRKEMGLGMEEKVDVEVGVSERESMNLLAMQQQYISREVRARGLKIAHQDQVKGEGYLKDWNIDDERFRMLVKRIPT